MLDEHREEPFYNQPIRQVPEEHLTAPLLEYASLPTCGVNRANENHRFPPRINAFFQA